MSHSTPKLVGTGILLLVIAASVSCSPAPDATNDGEKGSVASNGEKGSVPADDEKSTGEKFLADNATREGVVVLPSGLQYRIITEGTGASPSLSDVVLTRYRGTFVDGRVFDSTDEPISLRVKQVVAGLEEALMLMKEGGKWEVFIPQNLAYGARGNSGVPPYSALIFEVELVSIQQDEMLIL